MRKPRHTEASERAQERRDREDTAARLRTLVPEITSLVFEMSEFAGEGASPLVTYRKLVVVARAPALFEIRCTDAGCDDGGHNLTRVVMSALTQHATDFSGRDVCYGHRRHETCGRRLEYRAVATYEEAIAVPESRGAAS